MYEDESEKDWIARYQAPDGYIWVCGACGKRTRNKVPGEDKQQSYGWDTSCFMNAVLVELV